MSSRGTLTADRNTFVFPEAISTQEDSQALILPSTDFEKVMVKLNRFKVGNLNERQKEEIAKVERYFVLKFRELCWQVFGVSKENLSKLSREELSAISDELARRVKPRIELSNVFALLFPIIGISAWWLSAIFLFNISWLMVVGLNLIPGIIPVALLTMAGISCVNEETRRFYNYRLQLLKAYGKIYFPENHENIVEY